MADAVLMHETMGRVREAYSTGEWNQREWGSKTLGCGTAYCFAGWRVVLDGGVLTGANTFILPDGRRLHGNEIGDYARERLGLGFAEAATLFASTNTLEDLDYWANQYAKAS